MTLSPRTSTISSSAAHLSYLDDVAAVMTNYPLRPKGPQPVITNLTDPDPDPDSVHADTTSDQAVQRPSTAPRPDALDPQLNGIHRSATHIVPRAAAVTGDVNGSLDPRPALLRAKSDFGPRREENEKPGGEEGNKSSEGEWGIRHGFATQLLSEEYNSLLTSVRIQSYPPMRSLVLMKG